MPKKDLRERVRQAIENQIAYLESDPDLTTKDRIEVVSRLLPFVVSKISAAKVEQEGDSNDPINELL